MPVGIFSQNLYDKGQQALEGLPGPWCAAEVVEEPGAGSTKPSVQAGCRLQGLTSQNFSGVPGIISTSEQINSLKRTIFSQ